MRRLDKILIITIFDLPPFVNKKEDIWYVE
jgi:hypothetical protein